MGWASGLMSYPRFGPFGTNIGKRMPTTPQRPVKNTTGKNAAPMITSKKFIIKYC